MDMYSAIRMKLRKTRLKVQIEVIRKLKLNDCQLGQMLIDGEHFAYTLEDVTRDVKVYGETAIPTGEYDVIVDHSAHFNKELPHILNVKGFDGVRIHGGNSAKDTLGCILIGKDQYPAMHKIANCAGVVVDLTDRIKKIGTVKLKIS